MNFDVLLKVTGDAGTQVPVIKRLITNQTECLLLLFSYWMQRVSNQGNPIDCKGLIESIRLSYGEAPIHIHLIHKCTILMHLSINSATN